MNRHGAIADNDETINNFNISHFTPVPYTLQEDVDSDGNQLAYGDLVYDSIYTSPIQPKPCFFVEACIRGSVRTQVIRKISKKRHSVCPSHHAHFLTRRTFKYCIHYVKMCGW